MPGDYICISKEVGRGRERVERFDRIIFIDSPYIKDYLRPLPKVELGRKISGYG